MTKLYSWLTSDSKKKKNVKSYYLQKKTEMDTKENPHLIPRTFFFPEKNTKYIFQIFCQLLQMVLQHWRSVIRSSLKNETMNCVETWLRPKITSLSCWFLPFYKCRYRRTIKFRRRTQKSKVQKLIPRNLGPKININSSPPLIVGNNNKNTIIVYLAIPLRIEHCSKDIGASKHAVYVHFARNPY